MRIILISLILSMMLVTASFSNEVYAGRYHLPQGEDPWGNLLEDRVTERATKDLLDLVQNKGPDGVSSQDVAVIGKKYKMRPDQIQQLIDLLHQMREVDSSSQKQKDEKSADQTQNNAD